MWVALCSWQSRNLGAEEASTPCDDVSVGSLHSRVQQRQNRQAKRIAMTRPFRGSAMAPSATAVGTWTGRGHGRGRRRASARSPRRRRGSSQMDRLAHPQKKPGERRRDENVESERHSSRGLEKGGQLLTAKRQKGISLRLRRTHPGRLLLNGEHECDRQKSKSPGCGGGRWCV